ncbi:MAG: NAD(P)-dependent oxidoreductase [Acidobacteriota bacterium]
MTSDGSAFDSGIDSATRILVTGAGGFLGRPCCDLLADRGLDVHAVGRGDAEERQGNETRPGVHWWRADLRDPVAAASVVRGVRPTHLLHLAWATGADGFRDSPENYRWIGPGLEMLRAFAEVGGRRFVGVGTGAEYDWGAVTCVEGDTPLRPTLTYGLCKRTFFELFERFRGQANLSGAWGRLFFLYGPGEEERRLVSSAIVAALRGEPARCNYDRLRRDYLYVGDAAEGLVRLLLSDVQGPVNLASGEAPSLGELVTAAAARAGRPDLVELGGLPEVDHPAPTVVADVTRARRELGWGPTRTLDEGLDETVAWWRTQLGGANGKELS